MTVLELTTLAFFIGFVAVSAIAVDACRNEAKAKREAAIYKERLDIVYSVMVKMPPSAFARYNKKMQTLNNASDVAKKLAE